MHIRITIKWYQHNKDNFDIFGGQHYSPMLPFLHKNDNKGIVNGNCLKKIGGFLSVARGILTLWYNT